MPNNRHSTDFDHRLWPYRGLLPQTSAQSTRKNNNLRHENSLIVVKLSIGDKLRLSLLGTFYNFKTHWTTH